MFSEIIKRHKLEIAFVGDILLFIASISSILYVRYGATEFSDRFAAHREPFIIVLIIWLAIFYISNLYTYKAFGNILEISKRIVASILISFSITISIFYIFSRFFELTPKVNLVLFAILFGLLDIGWRYILRKVFTQKKFRSNILLLAPSHLTKEICDYVSANPQHGFTLTIFKEGLHELKEIVEAKSITQVVIDGKFLRDNKVTRILYGILSKQIEITTLTDFYESLFGCIPIEEIEEEWFIREITKNKSIYESAKYLFEISLMVMTLPITIPIGLIIAILVGATSKGPIIYTQRRVGKNNRNFTLYKFRTMKINQEGPLWTTPNDSRLTGVGKFLRHTHLDELPQLLNVFKGDISFVGPRPERTKLVETYESIPYYEIRHIIKPGIIGWAQLNYKPSTTLEEAKKKFQFDLYYIKNRSFILDIFIILKTARTIFIKS